MADELYDQIADDVQAIIVKVKAAAEDGVLSFGELIDIGKDGFFAILESVQHIAGHSEGRTECLVTAAERFYDEVLKPYDIKQIPNWIERLLDEWGRSAIRPIVEAMLSAFDLGLAFATRKEAK